MWQIAKTAIIPQTYLSACPFYDVILQLLPPKGDSYFSTSLIVNQPCDLFWPRDMTEVTMLQFWI